MKKLTTFYLLPLFILLFILSDDVFSQKSKENKSSKPPFKERIFVGGALGFSFGTYSTLVDVSPIIGYAVTNDFVVGVGLTYKYYQYRDYYMNTDNGQLVDFKSNIYGGSIWTRYFLTKTEIPVIENIFLHAEIEPLFFVNKYRYDPGGNFVDVYGNRFVNEDETITLTGMFLGGGLRHPIGGRSYMYIELLWDFNEDFYSPYSNPRIRIGVAAGF